MIPTIDYLRQFLNSARTGFQSISLMVRLLSISIILIILIIIYILYISNKKTIEYEKNHPNLSESDTAKTREDFFDSSEKMPPIGGWISEFLSRKGYFHVGDLSISFLRFLSFLKETIRTYNYKYQLPWFLVLGTERAGKSSLFELSNLHFPLGKPQFTGNKKNPNCQWWFLSNGVFIEPKGDLFVQKKIFMQKKNFGARLFYYLSVIAQLDR